MLAALLLLVVWPGHPADLGATVPSIAAGRALILEVVLTALLMLVIMSVATDTRAVGAPAALAIAAAVGLAAIAFGPLTGASLNTARSLGPALAAGQWQDFWIYVVGPFIGAPVGALAYQFVRGEHSADVPADVPASATRRLDLSTTTPASASPPSPARPHAALPQRRAACYGLSDVRSLI